MRKPYHAHENAYRTLRKRGLRSWDQFSVGRKAPDIAPHARRFLVDVLAQSWAPKGGKAVELGCGTGPMLRWIAQRGFAGLGIDISRTAIAMAKEQSKGLRLRFRQADVCSVGPREAGTFDLAVDGHCLHCITDPADREAYLETIRRLLRPGGVAVVQTMCSPVDRAIYRAKHGRSVLKGRTLYAPAPGLDGYDGCVKIAGRTHLPTRRIEHWKDVLKGIRAAGLRPQLIRRMVASGEWFAGYLSVAAVAA